MCGIATLTMLVSISSMIDASVTVIAMMCRFAYGPACATGAARAVAGLSEAVAMGGPAPSRTSAVIGGRHRRDDAHARPQDVLGIGTAVDPNAHRDTLDDLGKVAGRVVWGQQGEPGARRRAQALDRAPELAARVGVHLELHPVAHGHVLNLGF